MKSVTLYKPMTIDGALEDFDRYFGSFFGGFPSASLSGHTPAVDVKEDDEAYSMEMELPGYDEKNVEVHVDGRNLTVSSAAEEKKEEKKENYLLKERRASSFSRAFTLPDNADAEHISAVFKNGVLSLEIKKRPEAKKRLIAIEAR